MDEVFYTPAEVAEKFKVTKQAVYKWMSQGRLKYVIVGSEKRITGSALDEFVRAGTEADAEKRATPELVAA